jgi:adenylyltransferase/sulfurtransferase
MKLTEEQLHRYSRQIILPEIGVKGQERLHTGKVLVIGCGGLGSAAAYYLACTGIGTLGLVDSDRVELSNLHRQILHSSLDIGRLKIDSATEKLKAINPELMIEKYPLRLNSENILGIIQRYDFIIDGSDNFPTRYLVNDACVLAQKPFSHAGVLKFDGQVMTIVPGKGACYRCLFPEPSPSELIPSPQEAGILGIVPGILGIIQATEALKYILRLKNLLVNKLLVFNSLEMNFRKLNLQKNEQCAVCGKNPTITNDTLSTSLPS